MFFLMEVFLFFSLRPSQIREAFTYGSEREMGRGGVDEAGGDERQPRREIEGCRQRGGGSRGNKIRGGSTARYYAHRYL